MGSIRSTLTDHCSGCAWRDHVCFGTGSGCASTLIAFDPCCDFGCVAIGLCSGRAVIGSARRGASSPFPGFFRAPSRVRVPAPFPSPRSLAAFFSKPETDMAERGLFRRDKPATYLHFVQSGTDLCVATVLLPEHVFFDSRLCVVYDQERATNLAHFHLFLLQSMRIGLQLLFQTTNTGFELGLGNREQNTYVLKVSTLGLVFVAFLQRALGFFDLALFAKTFGLEREETTGFVRGPARSVMAIETYLFYETVDLLLQLCHLFLSHLQRSHLKHTTSLAKSPTYNGRLPKVQTMLFVSVCVSFKRSMPRLIFFSTSLSRLRKKRSKSSS